jgi:hypothetical protein
MKISGGNKTSNVPPLVANGFAEMTDDVIMRSEVSFSFGTLHPIIPFLH